MGWLGGLGPCDIARSVNQPFSYAIFGYITSLFGERFEQHRHCLHHALPLYMYVGQYRPSTCGVYTHCAARGCIHHMC